MKVITQERAQTLAANWHGGQWSALYQFASSGIFLLENVLRYLEEINQEIHRPETALIPFDRSKKNDQELKTLLRYFEYQANQNGLSIEYGADKYGIVPLAYLGESVPDRVANTINPIMRMA